MVSVSVETCVHSNIMLGVGHVGQDRTHVIQIDTSIFESSTEMDVETGGPPSSRTKSITSETPTFSEHDLQLLLQPASNLNSTFIKTLGSLLEGSADSKSCFLGVFTQRPPSETFQWTELAEPLMEVTIHGVAFPTSF